MKLRNADELAAWDRYAAAAVAGFWACDSRDIPEGFGHVTAEAATTADAMIRERRKRDPNCPDHLEDS